jgi:ADP-ribosylglycohydrolase
MIEIGDLKPEEQIAHEFRQLREEGADPSALEERWSTLRGLDDPRARRQAALELLDECRPLRGDDGTEEIADLLESLPLSNRAFDRYDLEARILGGWTGRMAGCLLGKPVEHVPRAGIRALLESAGEWPLSHYFSARNVPGPVSERYPWNRDSVATSMRENIVCMPEDDDINYAMLNLHVLETHGRAFRTEDIAACWLLMLPVLTVFTAERVAYRNLLDHLQPPETAQYRNPYREWIGAQIRADLWGWVSPGDPVGAAELAWRDARLSHTGNGIYGEMYVAALVAASFTAENSRALIDDGLRVIPPDSRLAEAIRFTQALPSLTNDWETAVDELYARYGHYHWVHTINNAALLTAALLYGQDDFERTIALAVMGGWDTDCNGASAGSIIGTLQGRSAVPAKWADPLNKRVRSSLKGYDSSRIDELATRTMAQVPERYQQGR